MVIFLFADDWNPLLSYTENTYSRKIHCLNYSNDSRIKFHWSFLQQERPIQAWTEVFPIHISRCGRNHVVHTAAALLSDYCHMSSSASFTKIKAQCLLFLIIIVVKWLFVGYRGNHYYYYYYGYLCFVYLDVLLTRSIDLLCGSLAFY